MRTGTTLQQAFQLTPSRRATVIEEQEFAESKISTHALTEGDYIPYDYEAAYNISTHALTEGDIDFF